MQSFLKRIREQQDLILFAIATFFGASILLNSAFGVRRDRAFLLATPIAFVLVLGFVWFLSRLRRKQQGPLRVESHPVFGPVRVFPDRWEATFKDSPFEEEITLLGDGKRTAPTTAQVHLFEGIRERFVSICDDARTALTSDLEEHKPPLEAAELKLESIWLGENSFSLNFGIPNRREEALDGFYVDFFDFKVEEAGWVH